jgi:hypothetical protein
MSISLHGHNSWPLTASLPCLTTTGYHLLSVACTDWRLPADCSGLSSWLPDIALAWAGKKTPPPTVPLLLHAYSLPWNMFTELLPSNRCLLWLSYSSLLWKCHNCYHSKLVTLLWLSHFCDRHCYYSLCNDARSSCNATSTSLLGCCSPCSFHSSLLNGDVFEKAGLLLFWWQ